MNYELKRKILTVKAETGFYELKKSWKLSLLRNTVRCVFLCLFKFVKYVINSIKSQDTNDF